MTIGCLIIHGFTGGPYEVEPLVTYLKEKTDWDIVVPVLPGHGAMLTLENAAYETWIEAAELSLKKLKAQYKSVYLIGFSMGGMIAGYLAGKWKVSKLVLLATAGKYVSPKQYTMDLAGVVRDLVKGRLKENIIYLRWKKKSGKVPWSAKLEFMKLVHYTREHLKDIQSPVFIAHGKRDGVVPANTVYYLNEQIKSSQKEIVLFEQSNHHLCLGEDKEVLNNMVYHFLHE